MITKAFWVPKECLAQCDTKYSQDLKFLVHHCSASPSTRAPGARREYSVSVPNPSHSGRFHSVICSFKESRKGGELLCRILSWVLQHYELAGPDACQPRLQVAAPGNGYWLFKMNSYLSLLDPIPCAAPFFKRLVWKPGNRHYSRQHILRPNFFFFKTFSQDFEEISNWVAVPTALPRIGVCSNR